MIDNNLAYNENIFSFGFNEFIICCGYLDYVIKEYFINYASHNSDLIIKNKTNEIKIINKFYEDWNVSIIFTGNNTNTGGRLKRIEQLIGNDKTFMMLTVMAINLDINSLINCHISSNKMGQLQPYSLLEDLEHLI